MTTAEVATPISAYESRRCRHPKFSDEWDIREVSLPLGLDGSRSTQAPPGHDGAACLCRTMRRTATRVVRR